MALIKIAAQPNPPVSFFSSCPTKVPKPAHQNHVLKYATGMSTKFLRSRYPNKAVPDRRRNIILACSTASFDECFDNDLSKQIEMFSQRFDFSSEGENQGYIDNKSPMRRMSKRRDRLVTSSTLPSKFETFEPLVFGIVPEPPVWPEREAVTRFVMEHKAKSVDLPLSLRMIEKKQMMRLQDGESASCGSVNKAFSSMLFIILELQKFYTMHMRDEQCYGGLMGARAEGEICESFTWLFQQVFPQTPSLMVYVMILLADFSVQSMVSDVFNSQDHESLSAQHPDDISLSSLHEDQKMNGEEVGLWNSMVGEATRKQVEQNGVVLGHDTMQCLTSPMKLEIESEDDVDDDDYFKTDLLYQLRLSDDPNNPLLLCNYAQFLFLVAHDHDRAEECFKRSIQEDSLDAESLSRYANFLWIVRKDLWGAEERYIQALAADPENPYHASTYANFLWSTGGEETCYPLDTPYNNGEVQNL